MFNVELPRSIDFPPVDSQSRFAPAVLDPTGVVTEGGPTTPMTNVELPQWIDHPRVDSHAMLSAFLHYRGRCTGEARAQLDHIYMIDHRHEPTVVVGGQVIRPQEVHPLPARPCTNTHAAELLRKAVTM